MRGSMGSDRRLATGLLSALLGLTLLVAACASAAVTPRPSPSTAPTPTPDPHLVEPASVADIFKALTAAGLAIKANNADTGGPSGEPRRRVNATFDGWPLILVEYSSSSALARSSRFVAGAKPAIDQPPFSIAGLNILVEYGPSTKNDNEAPDERFRTAAQQLVDVLDPLLSPLAVATVVPLVVPGADRSPVPSGAPASPPASAPVPSPSS